MAEATTLDCGSDQSDLVKAVTWEYKSLKAEYKAHAFNLKSQS